MELSLLLTPDAEDKTPLHRQIYQQIRDAILVGKLGANTRLPASRQLAKTLSVSRTTVVQSYDQLISEGYLQTKPGAGTFVCDQLPEHLLLTQLPTELPVASQSEQTIPSGVPDRLSTYGIQLANTSDRVFTTDCPLSFRYGIPDLSQFPIQQWRRLLNRHTTASTDWMDYGSDPMGHQALRQEIAQYIRDVRAVRATPEQILITNGTQQAISLMVQIVTDVGDAIALENPGYLSARNIFSAHKAKIIPIAIDSEGIRISESGGLIEATANLNRPPKLIYVTPSHQFPTGVLMSLSRRLALLRWANEHNALIIEDDYDSEYRYSGRPIPALQGLDEHNRVIYTGTFSKVMFPGLRLGYAVIPLPLVAVFRRAKWLCDRQCSLIDQAALADFIQSGLLAAHIRRMRLIYERRRRSLVEKLQQAAPEVIIPGDASGLHILAKLRTRKGDRQLIDRAKAKGVSLFSIQAHYWPQKGDRQAELTADLFENELIFGFGGISQTQIERAIAHIQPLIQT